VAYPNVGTMGAGPSTAPYASAYMPPPVGGGFMAPPGAGAGPSAYPRPQIVEQHITHLHIPSQPLITRMGSVPKLHMWVPSLRRRTWPARLPGTR